MTFIEGIGDEVTAFFVVLIVIILATLVTFIGSGPHLYSPVHTRTLQISVISGRELAEESSIVLPPEEIEAARNNSQNASSNVNHSHSEQELPHNEHPHSGQQSLYNQSSHNGQNQESLYAEANVDQPSSVNVSEESSHNLEDQPSERTVEQDVFPNVEAPAPSVPVEETTDGTSSAGQGMRVRLKYLDDTERTVRSTPLTKVAEFKRVHFPSELSSRKIVRLIFCGHLLRDSATLGHYKVKDNSVVHVQVLPQAQATESSPQQHPSQVEGMPDLSPLLWPLLTLTLGLLWGAYIKYPHLFSTLSLSCLFIFTAGLFALYRHR
ncbi:hypothetical protein JTE90_004931 [Oedothorax gibbosus]|uniref:Ubiquitin-like domain-containing protein n=1 Tax=Oedothorax gibbosus TaxID=931172 RepID=A0AAV6TWS1_9ARAC|nr:hypothetical protein JTE90_004931 [Oedothorax gibbosus]